jgi:adenylate cyclase
VTLTDLEQTRLGARPGPSHEAYDMVLRAVELYRRGTPEANLESRRVLERAIAQDPGYAEAHVWLGWTHLQEWTLQWNQDPRTVDEALRLARRALEIDPDLASARKLLAHVHLWQKDHAAAIAEAKRVLALAPNDADGFEVLGEILTWAGQPEEGIEHVKQAMRLNPLYPYYYLWALGHAHYLMRRYDEAIEAMKRAAAARADWLPPVAYLAAAYAELGRDAEARAAVAELSRLSPKGSEASLRRSLPYKDALVLERFVAALRRAGLGG